MPKVTEKDREMARNAMKYCFHTNVENGKEIFVQNGVIEGIAETISQAREDERERCINIALTKFQFLSEEDYTEKMKIAEAIRKDPT